MDSILAIYAGEPVHVPHAGAQVNVRHVKDTALSAWITKRPARPAAARVGVISAVAVVSVRFVGGLAKKGSGNYLFTKWDILQPHQNGQILHTTQITINLKY